MIKDSDNLLYYVTEYRRSAEDATHTNACLLYEGTKTYKTLAGGSKTVDAFTSVCLSQEETALLNKAVAAFKRESARLGNQITTVKAGEEFAEHKAKASDSAPAFQFLLARDYLEGRGTSKDAKTGMELLKRAAENGSGEAKKLLEQLQSAKPAGTNGAPPP